ncbi:hypothetical protein VUJ46_11380 [Chryseobacterium sp. MYb264]|uniref:hypothetical protein n=1 Tax=Chryseobacterium sp. MYb264 TaxID=2745153 RepID=UPI002E122E38|nr:hypothetical protein VUJ46_11380 [Chryseobacterium sp. MYb264]
MKTKLLLLFLLGCAGIVFGQEKRNEELDIDTLLIKLSKADSIFVAKDEFSPLVSTYTFTQMVKKDFSLLITGAADNTQVGKYAALSVDKNEQSFSFSPINYVVHADNFSKPFKHILAVNTSGKLNNNGFFDFSDRKKLQVGGSWTALWYSKYFYNFSKKYPKHSELYGLIKDKIIDEKNSKKKLDKLINKEKDSNDYKRLYHQEVEKYENTVYKNYWTTKILAWTKLDIGYAEDKLKIIDSINVQKSVLDPINKNIRGGYFSLSGNIFYGLKNGLIFYLNGQLSYSRKTSLSEIFSTVDWNRIQYGNGTNNTVYYDMGEQSVYITDLNKLKKRYKRDISVQLLCFIPVGQQNLIGLDLGYQNKEFITPGTTTFTSNKNIYSVGIMFPLKDKDGKTTINIEPFWRSTSFDNYDAGIDESFWGVKFGVPLNQLF